MAKNDKIDPKWFGKSIYRYHLKSSGNHFQYRCVSTEMSPMEAIKVLKDKVPPKSNMKLFCNGKLIHIYQGNIRGVRNKKTGDIWPNIEEFCVDNELTRRQAIDLIYRKKAVYEYIHIDN